MVVDNIPYVLYHHTSGKEREELWECTEGLTFVSGLQDVGWEVNVALHERGVLCGKFEESSYCSEGTRTL